MGKIVCYIRVSTNHQDLQNQKYEIHEYCHRLNLKIDEFIEAEVSSRKTTSARKIDDLLDQLNKGDELIVTELSRLGRSTGEVLNIINQLVSAGIKIHILKQNMVLTENGDMQSKVMVTMLSLFAELERDLISQRTKRALEAKRASGVRLGRPKGSTSNSKLDGKEGLISDLLVKKVSISSIAKILEVSRGTVENFIVSRKLRVG
jgi:DNA invertase Pin-like site-specific DNA recombinase